MHFSSNRHPCNIQDVEEWVVYCPNGLSKWSVSQLETGNNPVAINPGEPLLSVMLSFYINTLLYFVTTTGSIGSTLHPGQPMETPAAKGAAVMVVIELSLEAFRNIVHLCKSIIHQ